MATRPETRFLAPKDRLVGFLTVGPAASIWGTLGFFAKILYAEGVSFEALVAVRASVGWVAMLLFVLITRGVRSLRVEGRNFLFLVPLGLVGVGAFYLLYFFNGAREHGRNRSYFALQLAGFRGAFGLGLLERSTRGSAGPGARAELRWDLPGGRRIRSGCFIEVSPLVLATGLLSGLTYGLYSIFGKPVAGRLDPTVILSYALGFGAVLLVLLSFRHSTRSSGSLRAPMRCSSCSRWYTPLLPSVCTRRD